MGPSGNPSFNAGHPGIAQSADRYLVTWLGDDSVDDEVEAYGRIIDPSGAPLAPQARLSHMGPDGDRRTTPSVLRLPFSMGRPVNSRWFGQETTISHRSSTMRWRSLARE